MKKWLVLVTVLLSFSSAQADKIRLALNWKPEPQFGGFYASEKLGSFKEKGLSVEIIEGGSGTPTIQMLAAGQVEYAIVSADEIILAHDRGATDVVALYAAYQTNPQGILVHSERKFGTLQDVFKSEGTLLWQAGLPYAQYLKKKWAPLKVKTAPYLGGISNFQNDPKISQQCFVTSEPLAAKKAGLEVQTFLVADSGYNPYTTVLATKKSRIQNNSLEVQKVVQAVRQGWTGYLKDPTETNKYMFNKNKSLDLATFAASAQAQIGLVAHPSGDPKKLGEMEASRWQEIVAQLFDLKLIKSKPETQSLFQNF